MNEDPPTKSRKNSASSRAAARRPVGGRLPYGAGRLAVLGWVLVLLLPVLAGCGGAPVPAGSSPPAVSAGPAPATTEAPETSVATPSAHPSPAGPPAAPPQHLVYPAAGIDVVVYPLDPTAEDRERQTIIPPATKDGYWLTPYGMPGDGSTNTTYIVGHSWQDQDAPFNHLSTKAKPGDSLTVATSTGELAYQVETVTTYVKAGLKDSLIWAVAPNRVVLISCYTDDLWGTNVVVVAAPG